MSGTRGGHDRTDVDAAWVRDVDAGLAHGDGRGVYRWGNILFSKVPIASFRSDQLEGADWYRRGTRAHANCVENLPVFGAIVWLVTATGVDSAAVDWLCTLVLIARVLQSSVHLSHVQTDVFVAVRFSFFSIQLISFLALIVIVARHAA